MTGPAMPLHPKRLSTYLNDHLAVATAGVEVAKRTLSSNRGTPYEPALERIAADLAEDRRQLREVLRALGVAESRFKQRAVWVGERLGRLKLNDSLTSYSPLSRVVELESLLVVLTLLRATWASLGEVLADDPRMPDVAPARERAERNLQALEEHRPSAVRQALLS